LARLSPAAAGVVRPDGRSGYSATPGPADQVKETILTHPDFAAFRAETMAVYAAWRDAHAPRLYSLSAKRSRSSLIHTLAEDLLARFAPLICWTSTPFTSCCATIGRKRCRMMFI
jgi:hypothetical protein